VGEVTELDELHCFKCNAKLEPAIPGEPGQLMDDGYVPKTNQPYRGTTFHTFGHYGSTVFDPNDGTILELNICDSCLRKYYRRVLRGRPLGYRRRPLGYRLGGTYEYEKWDPDKE
jgi:hypothetical protein